MRILVSVLWLGLFAASSAWAVGGSPSSPLYTLRKQVDCRDFKVVTCTVAGDIEAVSLAEGASAQSIYFFNDNASGGNTIILCPRVGVSGSCDHDDKGLDLDARFGWTDDVAVSSAPWSCKGVTGDGRLKVYIQRDCGSIPGPTQTPMATQTPIPTPTPTPTP